MYFKIDFLLKINLLPFIYVYVYTIILSTNLAHRDEIKNIKRKTTSNSVHTEDNYFLVTLGRMKST